MKPILSVPISVRAINEHINSDHPHRHRVLISYLRSERPIDPSMRLYLADVLEELANPRRGAPKKSMQDKYKQLATKQIAVAATMANEIVKRWRDELGCKNFAPPRDGMHRRPIMKAAATEAVQALQLWRPGQYRCSVSDVEQRMRAVRGLNFRRLFNELESQKK